ncbi:ATP-dependent DNA helicase recQ, variant 2 [Coprinopsis cinerea AmutBmut pab1-1]|nr:ATP-dependent DNA helicase recQ, variant 2 [Coprinopsis cinerea AmutBmut pab1-1]
MARLINKRKFSSKVRFLFVDEAHSIYTFGASLYGQPAFRPAWSYLADLRTKLGSQVSVAALSGTMPKHMKTVIRETLQFDDETLCEIKLSCNRPNIAYAKHAIVGNLTDYRNLDFLISDETGSNAPDRVRRKTIVFHDRITDATGAKEHQEQQLPEANRGKGVIAYYHAGMSKQYLQRVHDDFRDPNGVCEILHATECASTGLDIRDVHCVIQYGLPRDMTTLQQRAGRPGRDGITNSVYVLLYEPFALTADLSPAREAEKMSDSPLDPDRPITGKLKPRGHKLHRIGVSVYDLVQDEDRCIRGDFASYNNDTSEHALKFTGPFCCNGKIHGDRPFDFGYYFPSKLLYFDATTKLVYRGNPNDPNRTLLDPPTGTKRKAARNKYRPVAFRASLVSRLEKFRLDEWQASKNHRR